MPKKKENKKINIPIGKLKNLLNNPYAILSLILCLIILYLIFLGNSLNAGVEDSSTVSEEIAAQNVIFFAEKEGSTATVVSTRTYGELYEITISLAGDEVPVYTTIDGRYLIPSLVPMRN